MMQLDDYSSCSTKNTNLTIKGASRCPRKVLSKLIYTYLLQFNNKAMEAVCDISVTGSGVALTEHDPDRDREEVAALQRPGVRPALDPAWWPGSWDGTGSWILSTEHIQPWG